MAKAVLLAGIGAALLAAPAAAQGVRGRVALPAAAVERPAAAWPAPPVDPVTQIERPDLFRATPDTYAPRYDRFVPPPFPIWPVSYAWPVQQTITAPPLTGRLVLDVQPADAEVYVDGYYSGIARDFAASGDAGRLDTGPHRIELRSSGFTTAAFDVRIRTAETITFRRQLARLETSAPPAPAAESPAPSPAPPLRKPFYVIPGCYAGDKIPRPDQLRPGCTTSNLRTIG